MASLWGKESPKAVSAECAQCQVSGNRSLKTEQDQRIHQRTIHQSWNSMQSVLKNYILYPHLGESARVDAIFTSGYWCKSNNTQNGVRRKR